MQKPAPTTKISWLDKNTKKLLCITSVLLIVFTLVLIIFTFIWQIRPTIEYSESMYFPLLILAILLVASLYLYLPLYFLQLYLIERHAKKNKRNRAFWGVLALLLPPIAGIAFLLTDKKNLGLN